MATFKPVGVDENSNFPTRVFNRLKELFPALDNNGKVVDSALPSRLSDTSLNATYAPKNAVEKIDSAGTHTPATFAVRLDANGDVDALVLNGVDL